MTCCGLQRVLSAQVSTESSPVPAGVPQQGRGRKCSGHSHTGPTSRHTPALPKNNEVLELDEASNVNKSWRQTGAAGSPLWPLLPPLLWALAEMRSGEPQTSDALCCSFIFLHHSAASQSSQPLASGPPPCCPHTQLTSLPLSGAVPHLLRSDPSSSTLHPKVMLTSSHTQHTHVTNALHLTLQGLIQDLTSS